MRELAYLDFDLLIERDGGQHDYRARVVTAPTGQTAPVGFSIPFSELELENFLLRIGRPRRQAVRGIGSSEDQAIRQFGATLFTTIFQDDLRHALMSSIDRAESEGVGLRVRLRLADVPELTELPWEFMYDPVERRFIALSEWTPLVRYLDLPGRVRPLTVTPPLNVLVVVAGPTDFPPLDVDEEWRKLQEALSELADRDRVRLDRTRAGTLSELQRTLRRSEYHVFHFIGHGGFDTRIGDGVLAFEDGLGRSHVVSGHDLGAMLRDHRTLRMAVLNSCEGARGGRTDPYAGTAQSIVRQGVPAVVAMQFEITDLAAITFSHALYEAVADGYPLDAALAEGRKAIHNQPNAIEWATPVLYLRSPDGRIFDVTTDDGDPGPGPRPKLHDDSDFHRARTALVEKRWEEAIDLLTRVKARFPTEVEVTEDLAHAQQQRELADLRAKAREAAEKRREQAPDKPRVGERHSESRKPDTADLLPRRSSYDRHRRQQLQRRSAVLVLLALLSGLASFFVARSLVGSSDEDDRAAPPVVAGAQAAGTIGLLLPETSTPVRRTRWEDLDRPLFDAKVRELCGDCIVDYAIADFDPAKQRAQAEALIQQRVKVLVVVPVNPDVGAEILGSATAAGIPVIAYERFIQGANYFVVHDNEKVGELQARSLVDELRARRATGGLLVINGDASDEHALGFRTGAHRVIDSSGFSVLGEYDTPGWSPESAADWMADQLREQEAPAGVYAANDTIAAAAIDAMNAARIDPLPPVTGQDATLEGIQRILTGEQLMTIYKPVRPMAEQAASAAVALLNGAELDGELILGVPSTLVPPVVVTRDNIKDTVVKDDFLRVSDICTDEYADECTQAGLS